MKSKLTFLVDFFGIPLFFDLPVKHVIDNIFYYNIVRI